MPKLFGTEVCRQTRKGSDLPVIILITKMDQADQMVGLELGADECITQPFTPKEVVTRVRTVPYLPKAFHSIFSTSIIYRILPDVGNSVERIRNLCGIFIGVVAFVILQNGCSPLRLQPFLIVLQPVPFGTGYIAEGRF